MTSMEDMLAAMGTKKNIIILDCETTGLDTMNDEILQLAIIDASGNPLYNSYLRPVRNTAWEEAAAIHGITPATVASAPAIAEELAKIQTILSAADLIVGYNPSFDLNFLCAAGCSIDHLYDSRYMRYWVEDLMELFAAIYGDWNPYYGSYTWKKLSIAAGYYGYDWGRSSAHDAMADCLATRHIWNCMTERNQIEEAYRLIAERNDLSV